MKLADYQQQMLDCLLQTNDSVDNLNIAKHRLDVYRNSIMGGRFAVLQQIFPCMEKLLGKECFQQFGESFVNQFPSKTCAIDAMGEDFSTFLKTSSLHQQVPYCVDMARFEWMWHLVFHGPSNHPIDYEYLAKATSALGDKVILQRAVGAQLISSHYSLQLIWEMCQDEYRGEYQIAQNVDMNYLILMQREQRISIDSLTLEQCLLLQILVKPLTLQDLCTKFEQIVLNVSIAELLPSLYTLGAVVIKC